MSFKYKINSIHLYLVIVFLLYIPSFPSPLNSFGIKSGISISNFKHTFTNEDFFIKSAFSRVGLYESIFIEFLNLKYFSIATNLDYLQRGGIGEAECYDSLNNYLGRFKFENKIDYLGFSLLSKFRFDFNLFTPYISFGPSFHLLIINYSEKYSLLYELRNDMKKYNFLIYFNGGILKNFKRLSIFIEYLLPLDVIPLFDNGLVRTTQYSSIINFGIKFNLKNNKEDKKIQD